VGAQQQLIIQELAFQSANVAIAPPHNGMSDSNSEQQHLQHILFAVSNTWQDGGGCSS
jgi:hypothetical protein